MIDIKDFRRYNLVNILVRENFHRTHDIDDDDMIHNIFFFCNIISGKNLRILHWSFLLGIVLPQKLFIVSLITSTTSVYKYLKCEEYARHEVCPAFWICRQITIYRVISRNTINKIAVLLNNTSSFSIRYFKGRRIYL